MTQEQAPVTEDMAAKEALLDTVYKVYAQWVERLPLACEKGCAACCTQSVTMTSLEGKRILDFFKVKGREKGLPELLRLRVKDNKGVTLTTNQYARACLEQREIADDAVGDWNFASCVFLQEDACSIYEVRPFGCRSFGSFERCSESSGAEISPIHLTVNTVFNQIIEHICTGGYWGNMGDVLESLVEGQPHDTKGKLLPAQPVPGFLLAPQQVKPVHILLKQLCEQSSDKQTFGDLIDNFMPI